jgi:hypothetical protein
MDAGLIGAAAAAATHRVRPEARTPVGELPGATV